MLGRDILGQPDVSLALLNVPPMRVYCWRKPAPSLTPVGGSDSRNDRNPMMERCRMRVVALLCLVVSLAGCKVDSINPISAAGQSRGRMRRYTAFGSTRPGAS